jgi:hypothetical protein
MGVVLANTGLVKSQRWGMKGLAVPLNPPDNNTIHLGPAAPVGTLSKHSVK